MLQLCSTKWKAVLLAALVSTSLLASASPALAGKPTNDEANSAEVIAAVPYSKTFDTSDATKASNDPAATCANGSAENSVWFKFTPAQNMRVDADTFGSDYDTILTVWSATPGATPVACNDDGQNRQSQVFFSASAGVSYYFMVSSYSGGGGDLDFQLRQASDELELTITVDDKAWAHTISESATVTGELTCSQPVDDVYIQVAVVQKRNDKKFRDYGYREIDCNGTEQWLLITGEGPFGAGAAVAEAYASHRTEDDHVTDAGSFTLTMRSCSIIGTLGDDNIKGTNKDDKICSLGGDDVVDGKDGDDELRGHDGDDRLVGGSGNDLLTGGYGDDELDGGTGNDTLYGDDGDDEVDAGPGDDRCKRGRGRDDESSCEKHF